MCVCACVLRIPEFKSFEELELPKHSKVKRQMSTPNASDLEQQPEISEDEWLHKPTQEIIEKFHVSQNQNPFNKLETVNKSEPFLLKCLISVSSNFDFMSSFEK